VKHSLALAGNLVFVVNVCCSSPVSTMVFKNLMPCYGEYSYHIQGHPWQTKHCFKTCPSGISDGQLSISRRMKNTNIKLPWQNYFTTLTTEALYQQGSDTIQCSTIVQQTHFVSMEECRSLTKTCI